MPTTDDFPINPPPGGSLPGGAASSGVYYGLKTGYSEGDPLSATDFDRIVSLLDNLTGGALEGIGTGTITGGEFGAASGLTVPVSDWLGILPGTADRAGYAPGSCAATTLTIPASGDFTVYAGPVAGSFADGSAYDTAESGAATFGVSTDGSLPDGAVALFSGTATATALTNLTDQRVFVGTALLQAEITALQNRLAADEALLGEGYFPEGSAPLPLPVDTRLRALEGVGADTGEVVNYWGGEARAPDDPQTIPAYVAAQLTPLPPVPTPAPLVTDDVVTNRLKNDGTEIDLGIKLVTGGLMTLDELKASLATRVNSYVYDPRLYGLDPAWVDAVHTTAPISLETGLIG